MTRRTVGYLLWDVTRMMRARFMSDPRMSCLTMAQAKALAQIERNEGVKQVELAEILEVKPMTLVRVIDSLVEEGLVERRPDPCDRRAHLIYVTPAADSEIKKVKSVSEDMWKEALEDLSDEQVNSFIETLEHIHHKISGQKSGS